VVTVDPEGLPRIYMARIVATLEMCDKLSSSDARGSDPLVGKSPLVVSPQNMHVAGGDGGTLKAGAGENLPELPESGLPRSATAQEVTYRRCEILFSLRKDAVVKDTNPNYQISAEWQNVTKEKWQASSLATRETQGKLRDVTEQQGEIKKTV
jgi:hypothetical protein